MKNFIVNFILLILPIATAFAQVPPPPPDYGEDASGGPGAPSKTPIDQIEFLIVLITVALIVGTYYYFKKNKVSEA